MLIYLFPFVALVTVFSSVSNFIAGSFGRLLKIFIALPAYVNKLLKTCHKVGHQKLDSEPQISLD